jgi:hypothetical protein
VLAAILLGVYLFFFAGGPDQLVGQTMTLYVKDQIKIAVGDEGRRNLALKGLSIVVDDIGDLNKQLSKDVEQVEKLIRNYNSKPEEFDQLFSSTLAKRQQQIDRIWDDRAAMLQHIQPDEWRAIMSGARAKAEKSAPKKK